MNAKDFYEPEILCFLFPYGLTWPITVAPYQVHLVMLAGKGTGEAEEKEAMRVYGELSAAGVEVLYDDRNESPGVKFNDADLIGAPIRLTFSRRSLDGNGMEFKRRDRKERVSIPMEEVVSRIQAEIAALEKEIDERVVEVPFIE